MSTLLIGFDSAWTAANQGAIVGVIRHDNGEFQTLGLPFVVNFDAAENAIVTWHAAYNFERTIILIDQPTIVSNVKGQRPVEHIVSSVVSRRYGGMQPANTSRLGMFDDGAPIWSFLDRFGGPTNIVSCLRHIEILETYPVLTLIARGWVLDDDRRPSGRLPKYNPVRRSTFRTSDWAYLCSKLSEFFKERDVAALADWIESIRFLDSPRKSDQDRLDACLCLLVAMEMAEGKTCVLIGEQESGYILTSFSEMIETELAQRCVKTKRDPTKWIHSFRV